MKKRIFIKEYNGNYRIGRDIKKLVNYFYQDLFLAVVVHGSLATNELVPYSDFDGLLIVKDEYKDSRLLKNFIEKSMKLIYKFDPLQHHGWFIIYENQLKNYPQTYFPYELFNYAKAIYPEDGFETEILLNEQIDYLQPLMKMLNSLEKKISLDFYPKNFYQLKSYLSEIMMLPVLYVQWKEKKGVFKKHCYEILDEMAANDEWRPVKIASDYRTKWRKRKSLLTYILSNFTSERIRKIVTKYYRERLNEFRLPNEYNRDLMRLIDLLKVKIEAH